MDESLSHEASVPSVSISLLDPSSGRALQHWHFESRNLLSIGRGPDQDVVIADPYVSRCHAEIRFDSGQWVLNARSQNGVQVHNQTITEQVIHSPVDFRLGRMGPLLRFQIDQAKPHNAALATWNEDLGDDGFAFQLDGTKVDQEVADIADGDFFAELQRKAKELRQRNLPSDPNSDR